MAKTIYDDPEVGSTIAERTAEADRLNQAAIAYRDRRPVGDAAVGLLDTLQQIGSIPLAATPFYELSQGSENSQILDQLRSPAYLQERDDFGRLIDKTARTEGELAAFVEAVNSTLTGNNLTADAAAQVPYLMLGPAARAMGVAAASKVPGVLGKVVAGVAGTGEGAVINRIAALSGVLEGAGGYQQTYARAIAEGLSPEQAHAQAQAAGFAATVAGAALGRLTPGLELDPLGRRTNVVGALFEDVLRPHVSAVAGEITEEAGIAITNTVVDNILAGKNPTEGLGGQIGQAAALAGAFSGALRTPGAIRDTSVAVGQGVINGLKAIGSAAASRAETPEDAATAVAQATVREEVIQSTEADTVTANAEAGSPGEPVANTVAREIEQSLPENRNDQASPDPTPNITPEQDAEQLELTAPPSPPETPKTAPPQQFQLGLGDPLPTTNSGSPAVDTILTTAALSQRTDGIVDGENLTPEQAKAIEDQQSYAEVSNLENAQKIVNNLSEEAINNHVEQASQGNVRSQQVVAAVAATDLTRVPERVLPANEQGLRQALVEAKEDAALDSVSQQILETGFEQGKKTSAKRKGMAEYAQAIRNAVKDVGVSTQSNMARRMAVFMRQLQNRAALFEAALARVENPTQEDINRGYIEVTGTDTLDADGNLTSTPFKIWFNAAPAKRAKSIAAAQRPKQDALRARKIYDALKEAYPAMFEEAERYADKEIVRVEERKAERRAKDAVASGTSATATPAPRSSATATVANIINRIRKAKTDDELTQAAKDAKTQVANLSAEDRARIIAEGKKRRAELDKEAADAERAAIQAEAAAAEARIKLEEARAAEEARVKAEAEAKAKTEAEAVAKAKAEAEKAKKVKPKAPGNIHVTRIQKSLELLRSMIEGVKWDQVGGRIIRATPDPQSPVVDRTTWLHSLDWWDRALGLSMTKTRELVEKVVADPNARLGKVQTHVLGVLLDYIDEQLGQEQIQTAEEEAAAERAAIQETEAAQDAAIAAEEQAETRAEDEAMRAYRDEVNALVDKEGDQQSTNVEDGTSATPTTTDPQETPDGPVRNPLLSETIKWVTNKFKEMFRVKPDISLEHLLSQLPEADRKQLLAQRQELLDHFKGWPKSDTREAYDGLVKAGLRALFENTNPKQRNAIYKKPFGVASAFWVEEQDADGNLVKTVPNEVLEAFATAAILQMYRAAARYDSPYDPDTGELIRDAIPAAWANEIARDAMTLLGVSGIRTKSETYTQGVPMAYAFMAVQALVDSNNFEMVDIKGVPALLTGVNSKGYQTQILQIKDRERQVARAPENQRLLHRVMKLIDGPTEYDASTEPYTELPQFVDHTRNRTSQKQRTAVSNLQQTPHYRNKQLHVLRHLLGAEKMTQLLSGFYDPDADENNFPNSVVKYLRSVRRGWLMELAAADHYDELVGETGEKPAYFKYGISSNGRTSSKWGPQSKKMIRDLYSSAYQQLNLKDTIEHGGQTYTVRQLLDMALAQAFGIKTDVYGPQEVLEQWAEKMPTLVDKATKLQALIEAQDQDGILKLLRENRSTPYSPREINALLTLGRLIAHGESDAPFENYLTFEIDGKTNGAFNTEMFFGLATITPKNLEQGGLMLNRAGTTWQAERERVAQWGTDFYTRLGTAAQGFLKSVHEKRLTEKKTKQSILDSEMRLLAATGLIRITSEVGQPLEYVFERLSGKTAALPVQYGGDVSGVQNQLWGLMSSSLVKSYLEAYEKNDTKQMAYLAQFMNGIDSQRKSFDNKSSADMIWYGATRSAAEALLKAYKAEKPVVSETTALLVKITNLVYAVKAAQYANQRQKKLRLSEANQELIAEFGATTAKGDDIALFAPSREDFHEILDSTIDMSMSTASGANVVSLNDTEHDPSAFRITGFGTKLGGNLSLPIPAEPGVRVLALLTIAAGDAAMGAEFNQTLRYITDVFDGIEFRITEFMQGGSDLNEAVWKTLQHDVLKDFFRILEETRQVLDQSANGSLEVEEGFNFQEAVKEFYNSTLVDPDAALDSFASFVGEVLKSTKELQDIHSKQQAGLAELNSTGPHTVLQMGGGGSFTTTVNNNLTRDALDELSLVDDSPTNVEYQDLSELGRREDGLYPNQPKSPNSTRYEDEEGLIDIDETGDRWRGTNTWNSPQARRGAGFRRLMKVLARAVAAGKSYDSDDSVHPSALKMYIRGIDAGLITADYNRSEVLDAIENNQVLRRDGGVFRNVKPTPRAAQMEAKPHSGLRTSFEVAKNRLNRSQLIAALDQITWPTAIHRTVWNRLRQLLPADVMVHLATTLEQWTETANSLDIRRRYGSTLAVTNGSNVMLSTAAPTLLLHELVHVVFTTTIANYINNINTVPTELRSPINDLIQLMERFKKLPKKGAIGFVQNVIARLEFMGDKAAALDEMLTYLLTEEQLMEEVSPGLFARATNLVKQILSRIFRFKVPDTFLNEAMNIFHRLADVVPQDDTYVPPMQPPLTRAASASSLEQLTEDAFMALAQRINWQQEVSFRNAGTLSLRNVIEGRYNLSPDQKLMFDRVWMLLRVGTRPADMEEFVSTTISSHPDKHLFNGAEDLTASVMALAAVEPTFRAQLEATWGRAQEGTGRVEALLDKGLNNAQFASVDQLLTETLSSMLIDREYNSSFLGTTISRLDRLGRDMLNKVGEATTELGRGKPPGVQLAANAVAALTSEKGAKAFGQTIMSFVNELENQRWLQDLVAAAQGTDGEGKLLYRAHAAMMAAISGTRAVFTTTLPKQLKALFPADFNGWTTLHRSFGKLDVGVLGTSAREMYLNDAERRRTIRVLQSQVENYVDAQNLAYYMVHQRIKPGQVQELLRNARAIADNINGERRTAPEEHVQLVDQLITLYAIDYLEASERASVAKMFQDHPEAMDNLVGMMQKLKETQAADGRNQYKYMYWKSGLQDDSDPRSSVVLADPIKGAALERLGYKKGERYPQTPGDPRNDLHYYTRAYSPTPTFTQGVINTAQQTAMGINYTTATTISPNVGTAISDPRTIAYIRSRRGMNSTLLAVYNFEGDIIGYERALDPAIIQKHLKTGNTQLHLSIGKALGRVTEEHMAKRFNQGAVNLIYQQWVEGNDANRASEYEQVNSSTDKQVARAWEVVPKEIKRALEEAFPDGRVMIRRDLLANTLGYYKAGVLEIYTGDASMSDNTRRALLGIATTVGMGPRATQILLAAEAALKEGVSVAKDIIIVRSLSVAYNNFMASANQVIANGVPVRVLLKRYQQGMREIRAYNRLQREVIGLTVKIAATHDQQERVRLETLQNSKRRAIRRLSIWPLVEAGDLNDLPEGLEETVDHSYLGDLAGWLDKHLRTKIHPKAPRILANVLFAKDSELHDAMSKAIQAGDFLARYTIYMHMLDSGRSAEEARDTVRDELISYQTNPGRLRAGLEDYGLIWWSQFTLRAQKVLLRRFRQNPFSFFVAQGLSNTTGTDGPLDQALWERGWDNSTGLDQMVNSPSAYFWSKVF